VRCEIPPGISGRPDQLREVVKAARDAGATGVWTNLLFLHPGTREHFLEHLAEDWPELVPRYRELYRNRAYLPAEETTPVRRRVSALARELGVADRRVQPAEPEQEPEQLALAV
jgi:DNA repair photolyase